MSERSEVPEGWHPTSLKDVTLDVHNTRPEKEPDRVFKYIDISSIDNSAFTIADHKEFLGRDAPSRARRPIKANDVLFSNVRTYLKNIGIVTEDYDDQLCSTGITILRPSKAILPKFLFYRVITDDFIRSVTPQQRGSQYPATSDTVVRSAQIPLPPLPEQHRIVAAIEALFARLDAANARLERVPGILKQFRQAVLAAACDGRLTEDWRQTNVVFECEADYLASSRAILNNDELSPAFSHTVQKDLPSMWRHVAFGSLGDWKSGATPSKSNSDFWTNGQIPWVSPKDMKTEAITNSIDHITMEAVEKTNLYILPKDSLIFVVRGMILARDFPVALTEHEVTINQDMRALIPNGCVYPRYLLRALQNQAHHVLRAVRSSTHGTKRLESPTLKNWPITLPPLPEQHEIVRRVDALFALADRIEAEVAAAREKTETMRQSILAQAFSGRLVPTEAELARREGRAYEPASVLLERIRSEKKEKMGRRGTQSTLV